MAEVAICGKARYCVSKGTDQREFMYILIDVKCLQHQSNLRQVYTTPMAKADIDSDHNLVSAEIRYIITSTKEPTNSERKFNTTAWNLEATRLRYEEKVNEDLSAFAMDLDVERNYIKRSTTN